MALHHRRRSGDPGAALRARVGRLPRRVSLRSGRLVVPITCTANCEVRSRLTIRRAKHRLLLAAARQRFSAGRHNLVLRLSHRDRRLAAGRVMRLHTVLAQPDGTVQLTQGILAGGT